MESIAIWNMLHRFVVVVGAAATCVHLCAKLITIVTIFRNFSNDSTTHGKRDRKNGNGEKLRKTCAHNNYYDYEFEITSSRWHTIAAGSFPT